MGTERVVFRRIRGRLIPIKIGRAAEGAKLGVTTAKAASLIAIAHGKQKVKPNEALRFTGFGLAVASGALSAATFFAGGRRMVAGAGASLGLDIASSTANIAAFANGKGKTSAKIKGAARQEGINTIVGNAVFAGGLLAIPSSRKKVLAGASKAFSYAAGKIRRFL